MTDTAPSRSVTRAAPRPDFARGTEDARASVLTPRETHGIDRPLRAALAARVCALVGRQALATEYAAAALGTPAEQIAAGAPAESLEDAATAAMVRHADLVTADPIARTAADIATLEQAGLTAPQIVALSELVAFANYHARIDAGLQLLDEAG